MWPISWTTVSRISRTASPRVAHSRRIGPAEDRDLGGQARDHRVALEESRAPEDPEEVLVVGRVGFLVVLVGRLVLDRHDDVVEVLAEDPGHGVQRLFDVGLELAVGDAPGGTTLPEALDEVERREDAGHRVDVSPAVRRDAKPSRQWAGRTRPAEAPSRVCALPSRRPRSRPARGERVEATRPSSVHCTGQPPSQPGIAVRLAAGEWYEDGQTTRLVGVRPHAAPQDEPPVRSRPRSQTARARRLRGRRPGELLPKDRASRFSRGHSIPWPRTRCSRPSGRNEAPVEGGEGTRFQRFDLAWPCGHQLQCSGLALGRLEFREHLFTVRRERQAHSFPQSDGGGSIGASKINRRGLAGPLAHARSEGVLEPSADRSDGIDLSSQDSSSSAEAPGATPRSELTIVWLAINTRPSFEMSSSSSVPGTRATSRCRPPRSTAHRAAGSPGRLAVNQISLPSGVQQGTPAKSDQPVERVFFPLPVGAITPTEFSP